MSQNPSVPQTYCPICRKQTVVAYRPFCSSRCADVDLGRWFTESYAAPAEDDEFSDDITIDEQA